MKNLVVLFALAAILASGCIGSQLSEFGGEVAPSSATYDNAAYEAAPLSQGAISSGSQYMTKESDIRIKVAEGTLQAKFDSTKTILRDNGAQLTDVNYYEYSDRKEYRITVKVPPVKFDAINERLKSVGEVKDMSVSLEDVTKQYTDLDTRIKNRELELDRLYVLYNRSDNISDLLDVEREITRVETDLELLKQAKQSLVARIELSTITVAMYEEKPATQQIMPSMEGLGSLFFGALAVAVSLVVALTGFLLPLILAVAVLWLVYRKIRGGPAKPRKPEHGQIPPPQ